MKSILTKKRLIILSVVVIGLIFAWVLINIPPLRYINPSSGYQYSYVSDNELSECIHETAFGCFLDLKCKLSETSWGFSLSVQVSCCPRDESNIPEDNRCIKPFIVDDVVPSRFIQGSPEWKALQAEEVLTSSSP